MKYVADDGTEFSTEKECLEYESNLREIVSCYIPYDEYGDKLPTNKTDSAWYIYIKRRPADVAQYLYDQYGMGYYDTITDCGLYLYDNAGALKPVNGVIDKLQKELDRLKSLKLKMGDL